MARRRTPSQDNEVHRLKIQKIKQAQGEFLYTICNPKTAQLESYYRLMSGHVVYTCFPATAEQVKEAKFIQKNAKKNRRKRKFNTYKII